MTKSEPNVVATEAAVFTRSVVFQHRGADRIDPGIIVTRLLADGYGLEFPEDIRAKRLRTWALQVLKRLRKHGWLGAATPDGWPPTIALKSCRDLDALSRKAPRRAFVAAPAAPPPTPPAPLRILPPVRPPQAVRTQPEPPESWEGFIQEWVFRHRDSRFGVAEVAVAVVQRGFGSGDIGGRLDGAREIIECELHDLERDGLLIYDEQSEFWWPTEVLRTWPST